MFVTNVMYFFMRMSDPGSALLPLMKGGLLIKSNESNETEDLNLLYLITMTLLNTAIVI